MPAPTEPFNLNQLDEVAALEDGGDWDNRETEILAEYLFESKNIDRLDAVSEECETRKELAEFIEDEARDYVREHGSIAGLFMEELRAVNFYSIAKVIRS